MKEFLRTYDRWVAGFPGVPFVFDLQLFAAEDEGRTEEPTEKKIREAREKGQVARTDELPQALVVLAGFFVILLFSSWIYETIAAITRYYLSSFSDLYITERSVGVNFLAVLLECGKILFPVFVGVAIAGILGNTMQVGLQVSSHPLKLDLSKIKFDPATIMKKIFFSKQVGMNLFKSLFKVIAIGIVSYVIISDNFDYILQMPDVSLALALKTVLIIGFKIIIWSTLLLLLLSVPDYFFQKQEFMESLKMTKQEVKEELKETMGDPYMRSRLREMQRELVMKNMIKEVPRADVVVTNPTHYAVALRYDRTVMEAPTVVAKGADSMALRIREIAKDNSVPLIENRPLAQEIYKRIDVGDIIPEDLFYAVSLVYAELYRKNRYKEAI